MDRRLFTVLILALIVTTACPPPQPTPSPPPPSLSPATGYSASCAGQSATLTLNVGQTGGFQVICTNTGTITWTRGTSTEASLVPCCPVGGSAPFPAWANTTRYAQSTSAVAPGATGFFLFNITVPSGTPSGTYASYGALVNASNQPISAPVLAFTVSVP